VDVDAGGAHYFQVPGLLQRHGTVDQTYYALYLVVGILLPLAVLAYSNFFLIRAVRNSRRMRRQSTPIVAVYYYCFKLPRRPIKT